MCLKVKKHLFACSFGFQALVYLCASNLEKVKLNSYIKAHWYCQWERVGRQIDWYNKNVKIKQ